MKHEKISIIVACYNSEAFLRECLNSICEQDYPKDCFEIVVFNDGSTDGSKAIIDSYQAAPNLRIFHTVNRGLEKTCNDGVRQSRFDWIMRVDADDVLAKNFLSTLNAAMQNESDYDFYYTQDFVEFYSEEKRASRSVPEFDPQEIFSRGDFFATGTIYKKSVFLESGLYEENVKNCGLENYNLILRMLSRNKKGKAVKGSYFYYRRHEENMSIVKRQQIIQYGHDLLARYGRPFTTNEYHPYGLRLT